MAVMKPDTFDVENKGLQNQASLILNATGLFVIVTQITQASSIT